MAGKNSFSGIGSSGCRMLNPICPPGVYIADPEVRQMPDGRIYIYGSKDEKGNSWCSTSYNVLSSDDMKNWDVDQTSFASKDKGDQVDYTDNILYAPDCIHRNGKYYLYYCLAGIPHGGEHEGVAVGDTPYGPFVHGKAIKGISGIDPAIFIDDDGQGYLYWGQGYPHCAKLNKELTAIEGKVKDSILTYTPPFCFNEGSSMRKHKGIYYYLYPSHVRHGESNCATLCYATSTSPMGPFTYRGVVIDNYGSGPHLVNNHGCISEINGEWYVFYHRPTHNGSTMRKVCVEPIKFNADGTIDEVEMTTQGIGGNLHPRLRMDAARACLMNGNVYVTDRRLKDDIPVEYLTSIRDGDYACWKYYDFSKAKVNNFVCKTWDKNLAGKIEIRLDTFDGELIGTCDVAPMNGDVAYSIHETRIKPVTGKHALVLAFKANNSSGKELDLMNLEWFYFDNKK